MAIFRKVHIQFWSDVFIQSLTPEQKFFFLYLLTNEKTKQCGIYEITTRHISYDTGYNTETVNKLIEFFENAGKILFSRETNEIAVKNWEKYNGSRSPDVQNLVNKELKSVKNTILPQWLHSGGTVNPQSKKSLREEPEGEQEQEQEQEREPEKELEVEKSEIGSEKVKEIANEVWKDQIWREQVCQGLSVSMEELKKWLAQFNSSVASDCIPGFNKSQYKKMSRGWIVLQKSKGNKIEMANTIKTSDSAPLRRL